MSAVEQTTALLADRGLATPQLMAAYTPRQIIAGCEAWATRVGIIARGVHAVGIASGRSYPGLFARLFPTEEVNA